MPATVTRTTLKGYFNAGDEPTENNFANLIDSLASSNEANYLTGSLQNTGSVDFGSTLTVVGNTDITGSLTLSSTLMGQRLSVESVTADDTLTVAESGKVFVFADAAAVLTLPDSGGGSIIGTHFTFISYFAGTGQEVIMSDTTNEMFIGSVTGIDTGDDTTISSWSAEAGDSYSSIEFTGATEGELGSNFEVINFAADRWLIRGVVLHDGTIATPFATS